MKKILLASTLLFSTAANADTVTVGYFDPAAGMNGIQILGTASGQFPVVQLLGNPILPTGATGFGFDQIMAMVIPPGGNQFSGGLGGPNPTFEFTFNDGFSPPQGGTSYLFASWVGSSTGGPVTMPTKWGVIESPPSNPGYTVTTQVLSCNTPNPFCGPFVGGTLSFAGQDQFTTQTLHDITLSSILPSPGVEAQNAQFKITEVFAFTGLPHPPFAQGDVGGVIETTFVTPSVPVPAPIVGTGPIAGLVGLGMFWLARKRRQRNMRG